VAQKEHDPVAEADLAALGGGVYVAPTGLTGATGASRYAGATASGAPTTGTFALGDYVLDQSGELWICTVAGSPGTWQVAGSGTELAFAANTNGTSPTFTSLADVSGVTITFTVGSRPVYVHAYAPVVANGTLNGFNLVTIADGSNVEKGRTVFQGNAANAGEAVNIWERISTPGTYTRKMRASNNAVSGTVTVFTVLAGGAWIRAVTA
jgi:hypothetical protein